jgi:hypothetical protein
VDVLPLISMIVSDHQRHKAGVAGSSGQSSVARSAGTGIGAAGHGGGVPTLPQQAYAAL